MLYPLKFQPILLPKVWGGQRLKAVYPKEAKALDNIGESWLVASLDEHQSVAKNGFLAENTLGELLEVYLNDLVGDHVYDQHEQEFPLLVKIIDTDDDLSIQVHPNDEIAEREHGGFGKNEMWYILEASDDAFIYAGFNCQITREDYKRAVEENNLTKYLQRHTVRKGDYIYIPAGCVHAIGKGCTLLEIQQSSDITYRIFDYNRPDKDGSLRPLHTEQALAAIDFENWRNILRHAEFTPNAPQKIVENKDFKVVGMSLSQRQELDLSEVDSFVLISAVEGSLRVISSNGEVEVAAWETVLVPAALDQIILSPAGKAEVLVSYMV